MGIMGRCFPTLHHFLWGVREKMHPERPLPGFQRLAHHKALRLAVELLEPGANFAVQCLKGITLSTERKRVPPPSNGAIDQHEGMGIAVLGKLRPFGLECLLHRFDT